MLEPDDTVGPDEEHHARPLPAGAAGGGGTDFGFAFGDLARFRVSIFKQRGNIAMVLRQIPNKLLTIEQLGLPDVVREADHAAPRLVPGHRPDRLRQEHHRWPA